MSHAVACVIPAYNAAETLPRVIAGVRRSAPGALVVVVDDGSLDGTAGAARGADVTVALMPNRGKGAALRAGFAAALTRDVSAVVTLDADGQHDPARIPDLVARLADADVVVGARRRAGTAMPLRRRLTNAVSTAAASLVAGVSLEDAQSGFRAMRRAVLVAVGARGDRYEFETDLLVRAARLGFRIAHVPVPTLYGARSHFRPIGDTVRVVATIWRNLAPIGAREVTAPETRA